MGTIKQHLTLTGLLLLLLVAPSANASTEIKPRIAILSTAFVMEHKFRLMEDAAAKAGVTLYWTQVDREGETGARQALEGADLIIIDAPRQDDQSGVDAIAGDLLAETQQPVIHINRMTPQRRLWAERIEHDLAQRVADYYLTGTSVNHQRLFAFLYEHLTKGDTASVPPPQPLPESGIYHPDIPDEILATPTEYLDWWHEHNRKPPTERPVIGIETTSSYIADGQTRWMDEMITAIEEQDALPLVFYTAREHIRPLEQATSGRAAGGSPTGSGDMDGFPNPAEPAWVAEDAPIITRDGKTLPDVLMVNNFLGGNPEGRKVWYQNMGLPVLNIINYRGDDLEAYLADDAGVERFSIPFTLTTAEYMGLIDPVVLNTNEDGEMRPVPGHVEMLVEKALRLVRLQQTNPADKQLALFFWNHPPGEHNMGASNMNVPRSLETLTRRMADVGYTIDPIEEAPLLDAISEMQRPGWRGEGLNRLRETGLWAFQPLDDYQRWFATLPGVVQERINDFFGPPEESFWIVEHEGEPGFLIPRLESGNLTILPQPMRGEPGSGDKDDLYHDTSVPVNHAYLATYQWVREQLDADAIIHFGTHGSQEWTPGKERGLWRFDDPNLLVGDTPVIYPYIVDNIGEAIHVKRRGRGVIISHQTPPFSPAGLSDDFVTINDLIREYQLVDDGLVRDNNRTLIIEQAVQMNIHEDLEWSVADLERGFEDFLRDIEDYLEDLGMAMQPLGLHTFGQRAEPDHLASTLMQMLGEPFYQALGYDDPGELFRIDYREMRETAPYRFVRDHIVEGIPPEDPDLAMHYEQGRHWLEQLEAEHEIAAVLHALDGLWVDPSYGGDPIRNPDALPTGRNMYGFDPSRVPTQSAWKGGGEALEGLLLAHREEHGNVPEKLAFSLWSTETMRHLGMLEAQVLHALGVRPVWDRGGRVVDMELISLEDLGRARIDVVLSITGLYRDQFPIVMERLNQAIKLVAEADEPPEMNPLRTNTFELARILQERGIPESSAHEQALTRIFGTESGDYGTGLPDATLQTDQWEADDGQLAEIYLNRMSWAYGPDPTNWSQKLTNDAGETINIYAEQLRGVDAAVFSRSSNLRGLLDTDHPFEYLGGISLAVQHLEDRAPQLYISNMRDPLRARLQTAERFLATELRAVYQHPNWLAEMQAEGYAGTLELLETINNFWGWQVMDRNVVRDDQWEEFHQTYVMDRYELDTQEWFEEANPTALAQIAERMLEAVRLGYWDASEQTKRELTEVYLDIAERHDVHTPNAVFEAYVEELGQGYGLDITATPDQGTQTSPEPEPTETKSQASPETVEGQVLEEVPPPQEDNTPLSHWLWLLLAIIAAGFIHRAWQARRSPGA